MKTYTKDEARLNLTAKKGSNEITINATGSLIKANQFTYRLPQDEGRREALVAEEGGEWAGKSPHLVMRKGEATAERTVWVFVVDLGDGNLVAENKTTILNAPAAKPALAAKPAAPVPAPKPAPAAMPAGPRVPDIRGFSDAACGNAQQGEVKLAVLAAFEMRVTSGEHSCALHFSELQIGRETPIGGFCRVKLESFLMRGQSDVQGWTLRISVGKLTFPFWVAKDGLAVDSLQGHESAVLARRLAKDTAGPASPFALDKALAKLPRREHHHGQHHGGHQRQGTKPQPQGHGQRPPAPPATKPAPAAVKPTAPPKAATPKPAESVAPAAPPPAQPAKADAGGEGGGKQATVQLELPANSVTRILVDTREEAPRVAAVTREEPKAQPEEPAAPAPAVLPTTRTENASTGESVQVVLNNAASAVRVEAPAQPVREAAPAESPAPDDKSPMAKFKRRQAATLAMQSRAAASSGKSDKPHHRKGTVNLAELDKSHLETGT